MRDGVYLSGSVDTANLVALRSMGVRDVSALQNFGMTRSRWCTNRWNE